MKVIFHTNLDKYSGDQFPTSLTFVPRVGEKVHVRASLKGHFESMHLPTSLKVSSVSYYETHVVCELWYSDLDLKFARLNNVDLFN